MQAYTPLPRQDQREAVDATYKDLVGQARKMKGSVFDTMADKAIRWGTNDQFGGLGPNVMGMPAQIVNPRHWIWQMTKPILKPETVRALEESPGRVTLVDAPQSTMSRFKAYGITQPEKMTGALGKGPQDVQVAVAPKAMQEAVGEAVGAHELAGHALPMTTTGRPFPYSDAGGMEVLLDAIKKGEYSPEYIAQLVSRMRGSGGAAHAGIEIEANRRALEHGFNPLIRDFSNLPPDAVQENIKFLQNLMQGAK